MGKLPRPMEFMAAVNLTTECNQNCIFCRANETFPRHEKISRENFLRFIEWVESYSNSRVVEFCGGEPTLHESIVDFARIANRHGYHVQIITNGVRLRKLAPELSRLQVSVQVSVEAPSEALHNRIVGRESFKEMVAGIREAVKHRLDISTNSTMNRLNIRHAFDIIEFVRRLGIKNHSINYLVPNRANTSYALTYQEISTIFQKARVYSDLRGIRISTLNPVPYCIGYNDRPCSAGYGCVVEPNLDVYPCLFTQWEELKMGNLAGDTPESLMESEPYRLFAEKKYLPEKCRSCRFYDACSGGCYAFWRFGLLSPDSLRVL